MKSNLTESQKRFEIENRIDLNMFVEAGAGAGKTTLIVKRILNQLKSKIAPGEIVVITFTNAAAEELRGRIAEGVRKANLVQALSHLDEMNISTIHAFCNVLLKEQAIMAGLPMDLTLMDEKESILLKKKYLTEFMSKLSSVEWDVLEADAAEDESRWRTKSYLEELYLQICDLTKDTGIITPKKVVPVADFLKDFGEFLEVLDEELLGAANAINSASYYVTLEDLASDERLCSAKTKDYINARGLDDFMQMVNQALKALSSKGAFFKSSGLLASYDKDSVEPYNRALHELVHMHMDKIAGYTVNSSDKENTYIEQLMNSEKKERHFQTLMEYAKKAKAYYYENRPSNMVSNDNILELTRDLICKNDDAVSFFMQKYKCFYVDEFQDTDSVQASFIYRLASDLSDTNHRKLRDGALFVVGDPKQSIYRFRGAQPKVYFDIKERMASEAMKNACVYELEKNFRSNQEIINWVNEKFTESDADMPIVDKQHPYRKMEADKEVCKSVADPGKLIHGVYRYQKGDAAFLGKIQVKKTRQKNNVKYTEVVEVEGYSYAEDSTEHDIKAVVDLILNLKNNDYMITDYQFGEDGIVTAFERPIEYKDFLLISQDTKKMIEYLSALKAYGIPVRFDGRADLSQQKALNAYVRLYGYLINPKEPFMRMAAKEAVRQLGLVKEEKELEKYTDAFLDFLYYKSKDMTAYGQAYFLEKQLSAILDKDREYSQIEVYTIQSRLRQMIETVFSNVSGTGILIEKAFQEYLNETVEHELSLEENPDAVRFMNLHKSKGLEGNIVIILDRRGHRKSGIQSFREDQSFYPGIKEWSSVSGLSLYKDKNDAENAAEFHRLEYVAVTRAKQAVIFMNVVEHGGIFATSKVNSSSHKLEGNTNGSFDYKINECPSVEEIVNQKDNKLMIPAPKGCYDYATDGYAKEQTPAGEFEELYEKKSPSGLEASSPTRRSVKEQEKAKGRTEREEFSKTLNRPVGNIMGNILHRTMELLIGRFDKTVTLDRDMQKIAYVCMMQAVAENKKDIPDQEQVEDYKRFVAFAAFYYYKWLLENRIMEGVKAVHTELPFSYFTKEDSRDIWMNGTADLILEYEDGRVRLIDYKSDNDYLIDEASMEKSFVEIYKPQLDEYKKIIVRMLHVPMEKIETAVVSFSQKDKKGNLLSGNEIRVRYTIIS